MSSVPRKRIENLDSVLENTGRASVNVSPLSLLPYLSGKRSYTNSGFINYVLTKSVRTVTSPDSAVTQLHRIVWPLSRS